jgi:hypothetical protein
VSYGVYKFEFEFEFEKEREGEKNKEEKKIRSACFVRRRLCAKVRGPPQAKPATGFAIFSGR